MSYRPYPLLSIGQNGVQETALVGSSAFAIPNDNAGNRAQRVAIRVVTASETVHVLPTLGGAVTAETGIPVAKETPIILDVAGYTHVSAIRAGGTNVVFNITPIEN